MINDGHSVPIEKIVSRYTRSMGNLSAALALCDRVYLFDNSIDARDAILHARVVDGQVRKLCATPPAWIVDALEPFPRHPDFVGP